MSQNSQDAIDVLSKVIVDTIEKKLNDDLCQRWRFKRSRTDRVGCCQRSVRLNSRIKNRWGIDP